jgi:Spy/CpxP family protein refolding chaperone
MKVSKMQICGLLLNVTMLAAPAIAQEEDDQDFLSQVPEAIYSEIYLANLPETTFTVPAGPPGWGPGGQPPAGPGDRCGFESLGLSDEQMEKFVAVKGQYEVSTAGKKAELKQKMRQMMQLLTDKDADKQKVLGLQAEINSLRSDLSNGRVSFMLDAAAILTPEQKKQIRHKMLTRMMRMCGPAPGHHMRWHGRG